MLYIAMSNIVHMCNCTWYCTWLVFFLFFLFFFGFFSHNRLVRIIEVRIIEGLLYYNLDVCTVHTSAARVCIGTGAKKTAVGMHIHEHNTVH